MLNPLKRTLRWLLVLAVLAGGLVLPAAAHAGGGTAELKRLDRELDKILAKKKQKKHHKAKQHHKKKHHHKKKSASLRQLEQQLDQRLDQILKQK